MYLLVRLPSSNRQPWLKSVGDEIKQEDMNVTMGFGRRKGVDGGGRESKWESN